MSAADIALLVLFLLPLLGLSYCLWKDGNRMTGREATAWVCGDECPDPNCEPGCCAVCCPAKDRTWEAGREATVEVPRTLLEDIARRLYTAGDDLYREQVEALLDATPPARGTT